MSYTLAELAKLTQTKCKGNPDHQVDAVADLESATERDVSFLANPRYYPLLPKTRAGIICVDSAAVGLADKNYLISQDPSRTFQQIIELIYGERKNTGFTGIHPTAVIHPKAKIDDHVSIGPYAVVDEKAEIGSGTTLGPFTYVGFGSVIGKDCMLYSHSVVREYCLLKDRVILQPGAIIGSCGFGYTTNEKGIHIKIKQLGNVVIEDDVEIGANTTIDRARFKTTLIRKGTKIDNLVQIAHNVELGEHNLLAAQTGIAGSSKTGKNVFMGGQVGVVGHVEITDFVMIATRGGVSKHLKKPGKYGGGPVVSLEEHNRTQVHIRNIDRYVKKIELLEKKLRKLEEKSGILSSCQQ